jgi:hypothetical protein
MQAVSGIKAGDLVYSERRAWTVEQVEAITHTGTQYFSPPWGGTAPSGWSNKVSV